MKTLQLPLLVHPAAGRPFQVSSNEARSRRPIRLSSIVSPPRPACKPGEPRRIVDISTTGTAGRGITAIVKYQVISAH